MKAMTKAKLRLLFALANMPDEAFGWVVQTLASSERVFPSGLGGFRSDSRDAIVELRASAAAYRDDPNEGAS